MTVGKGLATVSTVTRGQNTLDMAVLTPKGGVRGSTHAGGSTHACGLNMLDSWKQWVARGWVGRFRGVFTFRFRFNAGLMAAAAKQNQNTKLRTNGTSPPQLVRQEQAGGSKLGHIPPHAPPLRGFGNHLVTQRFVCAPPATDSPNPQDGETASRLPLCTTAIPPM